MAIEEPYWVDREAAKRVERDVATMLDVGDHIWRDLVPEIASYDGTPESIYAALSDTLHPLYQERHERLALPVIRQAMRVFTTHRQKHLLAYVERHRVPTLRGYIKSLQQHYPLTQL